MLPAGEPFALGGQLMRAVLCTNVVYPVYTRGQYIRHNTPGRWWDSLYTWDSGFIGMGLAQFSARRGFDCLNAYLTPPATTRPRSSTTARWCLRSFTCLPSC